MKGKSQIIQMLKEEYLRWDELLAGLTEEEVSARELPSHLSIKDVVAHLYSWQQLSIARLEAARSHTTPVAPEWAGDLEPDVEENLETINARIHALNRDRSWASVERDWRAQVLHLLELAESIPERDLLEEGKYAWIGSAPLSAVLLGSYEHHHEEHLEPLLGWLNEHRPGKVG